MKRGSEGRQDSADALWRTWGGENQLTPEQIIEWLEGYRALVFEIWRENPEMRLEWERINLERQSGSR